MAESEYFKPQKIILVIASVILIAVFHYNTELTMHRYHILYQGLFFIPVMLAGFWFGLRGGLLCSLSITLIYTPFLILTWSHFSAMDANNVIELVLYNAVAVILGTMKDREKARQNRIVESEKQLRGLSLKLLNAQESERKMVAQELHDSICGSLAAIRLELEVKTREMCPMIPENGNRILADIVRKVEYAGEETRRIMRNLRPSMLDELGLLPTLSWFCREFQKVNSGIRIDLNAQIEEREIPESLKIVIFRVVQEALSNVQKYSRADRVTIDVSKEKSVLKFQIEDNGQGFEYQQVLARIKMGGGFGLNSMRERVQLTGGKFTLRSAPGQGVSINAEWQAGAA